MVNYRNGKIYCIRSLSRPDLIYIGSTCNTLSKRFSHHKTKNSGCSSKQMIDIGDSYIELIEDVPCENKNQLIRREGQLIRSMDCVNKCIAGRTRQEWENDNRDRVRELKRVYMTGYAKKYEKKNREIINERKKVFYNRNKERLNKKMECLCGVILVPRAIYTHRKTKNHQQWQKIYDFIYD